MGLSYLEVVLDTTFVTFLKKLSPTSTAFLTETLGISDLTPISISLSGLGNTDRTEIEKIEYIGHDNPSYIHFLVKVTSLVVVVSVLTLFSVSQTHSHVLLSMRQFLPIA